jgi:hydrogenase/urease accessory protein HupE
MTQPLRSATLATEQAMEHSMTLDELRNDPLSGLQSLEREVVAGLWSQEKRVVRRVWWAMVATVALALLVAAGLLGSGVTIKVERGLPHSTNLLTILVALSAVVGFLVGLLAPAPPGKDDDQA